MPLSAGDHRPDGEAVITLMGARLGRPLGGPEVFAFRPHIRPSLYTQSLRFNSGSGCFLSLDSAGTPAAGRARGHRRQFALRRKGASHTAIIPPPIVCLKTAALATSELPPVSYTRNAVCTQVQHRPGSEVVSRWRRVVNLDPVCSLLVEAAYLSEIQPYIRRLALGRQPPGFNHLSSPESPVQLRARSLFGLVAEVKRTRIQFSACV